jgi:hypothetical protein
MNNHLIKINGRRVDLFPKRNATVSHGPYGLIQIDGGNRTIYVNSNGLFDRCGKKINLTEAMKSLDLEK